MDPLSLSLGIAGILPLIASAIFSVQEYVDAVRAAKKSIADLITELEALQYSLTNLHELLKGNALNGSGVRFHKTSVLLSCSAACEAKLRSLCKKLGRKADGRSHFLWPFTEKEHQKTIQELRNFTNWMQFALSVDNCRLLSQTSDDVLKLMSQQLDQFQAVQSLEVDTIQILDLVEEQKRVMQDSLERETRRSILDWISVTKYHQKHQLIQTSRARDTGAWILQRDEFVQWRDGRSPSNVLWCHGIQGSGKTHIASIIIDLHRPMAFFYFDHQDQLSQTTSSVLCCILRQLLEKLPEIPASVVELFKKRGPKGQIPLHECERLLVDLASSLRQAYLVFDGLDESEHQKSFLQSIQQLVRSRNVRLLDIFQYYPNLRIEAHEEDIKTYLYQELHRGGIYDIADEEFVNKLTLMLSQGAEGMFLLPVLQLRTILKEATLGEMEDRLADLSHGLNDAFADTVSRIQRLPESRSRLSMAALMWLTHTPRALTESELSDALAVRSGQKVLNVKYRPTTKMILECCQGLVVVDAKGYVHLAHYAIHEYMRDHSGQLFPRAQATMALTCLRYLLCENFQDGPWQAESLESRMYQFPFLDYSSIGTETDEEVWAALLEFFASPPAMSTANQGKAVLEGIQRFGALHHASRHGLERAVSRLLEDGNHDVNVLTKMGLTPIIAAAAAGHTHTMRRLLAKGADPYLCNWYGNALHCAARVGEGSHGARTSDGGNRGAPISAAALDEDAADAFEALCEHHMHGHLFLTAASWGDHQVIALMLRREDADGNTALHYAAVAGDPTTVGLLLEAGVDINAENNIGHTALVHAEARGEQMVARLLLDAGATPLNVALGTVVFSESLFI
ncbi:hypothetical protein C8J57DRAFT_1289674 [Mycena rebaudengoi]|nr:hypothetical protein C8J57DRAFT_1289674 [Mycena rebaudengoi]